MLSTVSAIPPSLVSIVDSKKALLWLELHKSWALATGLSPFFATLGRDISPNSGQEQATLAARQTASWQTSLEQSVVIDDSDSIRESYYLLAQFSTWEAPLLHPCSRAVLSLLAFENYSITYSPSKSTTLARFVLPPSRQQPCNRDDIKYAKPFTP